MKKFYVIANKDKDRDFVHARSICEYIEAQGCVCSYQEYEFAKNVCTYNIADIDKIPTGTECVLVLGGDGTLIQAARDLADGEIPVFGINIGNLGFSSDVRKLGQPFCCYFKCTIGTARRCFRLHRDGITYQYIFPNRYYIIDCIVGEERHFDCGVRRRLPPRPSSRRVAL